MEKYNFTIWMDVRGISEDAKEVMERLNKHMLYFGFQDEISARGPISHFYLTTAEEIPGDKLDEMLEIVRVQYSEHFNVPLEYISIKPKEDE